MTGQGYEELIILNRKLDELFNRYNNLKAELGNLRNVNEELKVDLQERDVGPDEEQAARLPLVVQVDRSVEAFAFTAREGDHRVLQRGRGVDADLDRAAIDRAVELAVEKYCAVLSTVARAATVEHVTRIQDDAVPV